MAEPLTEAAAGIDRATVVPRMETLLDRLMKRRHVHHAVVGVASLDGSWAWSGATGVARPDGTPMRPDTPWFLASVTKLYIATVVLRVHERGLVDLDAPITHYLPSELISGLHVLDGVDHTGRITPTHLLGHLTGLPDYLGERPRGEHSLIESVLEGNDRAWSFEEAIRHARDRLTPHFPPSDPSADRPRIRYCDTNYVLLMLIAEHVTGRTMRQLHRELILDPLRLHHTWMPGDRPIGQPAAVWTGNAAPEIPLGMESFGDLYATTDDVLGFGRALFTGEIFDRPASAELMGRRFRRFGLPTSVAALAAPTWPIEYGLGMMRFELSRVMAGGIRIPTLIGHTGSTGSWLWYSPALRLLLAGTVDQVRAATVPFRVLPRALAGLTG